MIATDTAIFARRNAAGHYAILDAKGMPVTTLDGGVYPYVYPVGSTLAAHYEHAEGIVLDEASVIEAEIDFEDGFRIDTEQATYTYPAASEDIALDKFAQTVGYDDYASLAMALGKTIDEAKSDLVITRT